MFQSRRFCDSYRLGTEEEAAAAGTISIRLVAFWELSELSGVGIISMGLIFASCVSDTDFSGGVIDCMP